MSDSLKYLSIDLLTGLGDKEAFNSQLSTLLLNSSSSKLFSMIIIDIDHFKSINDGFGHRRGDQILSEFGARVTSLCRENDFIYRYGGDEFVGLFPKVDKLKALSFAQRLLDKIRSIEFEGDPPLSITLSVGIAEFPFDGKFAKDLFDTADKRLYVAKRNGRDRIVFEEIGDNQEINNTAGRLLGREKELKLFVSFAEEAADKGRGFFLVNGSRGAGKGYFLEAVSAHLLLNNYKILTITGQSAEQNLPHSSLAKVLLSDFKSISVIDSLYHFAGSSMSLAIILENAHFIDKDSIEDILSFYAIYPGWMIIVASTDRNIFTEMAEFGGVTLSVKLGAVTLEDCRAWFRANVMWNPPIEVLEWFHKETGGLPGLFSLGLKQLRRRGYLAVKNGQFIVHENCMDFSLGERLALGSTFEVNNLPATLSPFQGRVEELSLIRQYTDSGAKLINIKGEKGVGKLRLAIKAASQNEFSFSSGICFIDCAKEMESITSVIASILSLPINNKVQSILENFLSEESILFVLANINFRNDVISLIQEIIQSCSKVRFIVTSNILTGISDEVVLPVSGVSTFKQAESIPSVAARIFIQTSERRAGERFTSDEDLNIIEKICSLVNGNPLAIELAASWMRIMSITSICRRIEATPSFLSITEKKTTSDNLSDICRESFNQLPVEARNAVFRLTVFAGHFSLEEAEQIADVSPEILISLLNSSLLVRDDKGIHIPRITLDQLNQTKKNPADSKGIQVAREMHCRHFAAKVASLGNNIVMGSDVNKSIADIKASFGDILKSWKEVLDKSLVSIFCQIIDPIFSYCILERSFRTGFNLFSEALTNSATNFSNGLRAELLAYQSFFAYKMGNYELSQKLISKALNILEKTDYPEAALVLYIAGELAIEAGQLAIAKNHIEKALMLYPEEEISVVKLKAELLLVKYDFMCGNYLQVRSKIYSLSERCQKISYRSGVFEVKFYYGKLAVLEGDFRKAKEIFLRYFSFVKTAGFFELCALVLREIAKVERGMGSDGEALDHLLAASDYYSKSTSPALLGNKELCLAEVQLLMKANPTKIEEQYFEALKHGEISNSETVVEEALIGIALNRIFSENVTDTSTDLLLKRAVVTASNSGNKPNLIKAFYGLALTDSFTNNLVRATITILSLLQNSSIDFQFEALCVDLIGKLREMLGSKHMDILKQDTETIALKELIDIYEIDCKQSLGVLEYKLIK